MEISNIGIRIGAKFWY